jgi:hypothetical protein
VENRAELSLVEAAVLSACPPRLTFPITSYMELPRDSMDLLYFTPGRRLLEVEAKYKKRSEESNLDDPRARRKLQMLDVQRQKVSPTRALPRRPPPQLRNDYFKGKLTLVEGETRIVVPRNTDQRARFMTGPPPPRPPVLTPLQALPSRSCCPSDGCCAARAMRCAPPSRLAPTLLPRPRATTGSAPSWPAPPRPRLSRASPPSTAARSHRPARPAPTPRPGVHPAAHHPAGQGAAVGHAPARHQRHPGPPHQRAARGAGPAGLRGRRRGEGAGGGHPGGAGHGRNDEAEPGHPHEVGEPRRAAPHAPRGSTCFASSTAASWGKRPLTGWSAVSALPPLTPLVRCPRSCASPGRRRWPQGTSWCRYASQ